MPIKTAEQMLSEAKARIKEYSPAEVKAMVERGDNVVLLDCRELPEVNVGKIPNAIHISRGRLEQNIEAAVPRDANVVIYCANGNRSALAAVTLQEMGYEHVSSMSGGVNGWTAVNGDIE
jgi:rhodanese-related sulfurtransferase